MVKEKIRKIRLKKQPDHPDSSTININLVLFIAIFCFLFGVPFLAYFLVNKIKKLLIYFAIQVILLSIMIFGGIFTAGILCFIAPLPLFLIFLINILIVIDVYQIAKGEKGVLPPH